MTASERLQLVRELSGMNHRGFYRALGGKQATGVTETASQRYHAGQRKAPARYMALVARQFDIDIYWLILGEGTPPEESAALNEIAQKRAELADLIASLPQRRRQAGGDR